MIARHKIQWADIGLCFLMIAIGTGWILDTMAKNDLRADCCQRGGVMVKVDGERQCDLRGGSHGR